MLNAVFEKYDTNAIIYTTFTDLNNYTDTPFLIGSGLPPPAPHDIWQFFAFRTEKQLTKLEIRQAKYLRM